jgi:DNA repair exonuclease SbcCD ATPase subunit
MWTLSISNIAGIYEGTTTLEPGTNAIQASNWQGKTSFVTALRTILVAEPTATTVTAGQSEGSVTLETDDDTYAVTLSRTGETVTASGDPYVTDPATKAACELFALLDGHNEIREAVRTGADLTPLLTRPLDYENIDVQIAERKEERERVEAELERAETAASKLAAKQSKRETVAAELSAYEAELAELAPPEDDEAAARERLADQRTRRESLADSATRLEREIGSIETELADKRTALEDIDLPDNPAFADEIETKRDRLEQFDRTVETLRTLYNANKQVVEGDSLELVTDVEHTIDGDTVSCWVCDTETDRDTIERQLASLSALVTDQQDTVEELREEVQTLERERDQYRAKQREKRDLESTIATLETRLAERQSDLEEVREELDTVEATVAGLEADVAETDERRDELETQIARTEATLETVREECAELEQRASGRAALEERLETLTEEIETLRTRRERQIDETRTAFEDALEGIIEALSPSFESARLRKHVDEATGRTERLELAIARDGREVSVEELSEGEVELVGFITTLAGYEAFDVADSVPCLVLDEVGGLASDNLADLIAYLQSRTTFLVTTVYPEVANVGGQILSPSEWTVVSD